MPTLTNLRRPLAYLIGDEADGLLLIIMLYFLSHRYFEYFDYLSPAFISRRRFAKIR